MVGSKATVSIVVAFEGYHQPCGTFAGCHQPCGSFVVGVKATISLEGYRQPTVHLVAVTFVVAFVGYHQPCGRFEGYHQSCGSIVVALKATISLLFTVWHSPLW